MHLAIEADGGSRGNPGIAGSGTVLLTADRRDVLENIADYVGTATNNVAEYQALRNGLEAAERHGATRVDVYMDSKLVVEQMSGRWKIKHPDMKKLAIACHAIAERIGDVRYTWVPRKDNSRADALANKAMDAGAKGAPIGILSTGGTTSASNADSAANADSADRGSAKAAAGTTSDSKSSGNGSGTGTGNAAADTSGHSPAHWNGAVTTPTRLILLRHGQTEHSARRLYSGAKSNPPLTELGQQQAEAAAQRLTGDFGEIDHIVASPQLRAQQTAHACAEALNLPVDTLDLLQELDFGTWEGLTFAQAHAADPDTHTAWLSDTSVAPPGGETLQQAYRRAKKTLTHLTTTYPEKTVLVVSHVTPIKGLLRLALDAGPSVYHRLHLDLASISIAEFYADGPTTVRLVGDTAHLKN